MLLTFRVSNFLSFNEEVEFSMLAGQVKQPENHVTPLDKSRGALKSALIYGANASGKSNLLKSIDYARQVLLSGTKKVMARNLFFRLEKDAEARPSKFEFEIKIGEKVYAYGFTVMLNTRKICEEWLFLVKKSADRAIFERTIIDGRSEMASLPTLRGAAASRLQVYVDDLSDEQLLLNVLHNKRGEEFSIFHTIYNWFANQLIVFYPESIYPKIGRIVQEEVETFSAYLRYFKTGIEEIEIEEEELSDIDFDSMEIGEKIEFDPEEFSKPHLVARSSRIAMNSSGDIVRHHLFGKYSQKGSSSFVKLDLNQESDGNRRLIDIIPLLIEMSRQGKTVFIDEIDRSLHPELTRRLLEAFFQRNQQPESQLILITHESSLLDLNLLRRDEIWFAEKNADGASRIYSLEEFKPRFDTEIRKAYLQGRYGAIPFIADAEQLGW